MVFVMQPYLPHTSYMPMVEVVPLFRGTLEPELYTSDTVYLVQVFVFHWERGNLELYESNSN